MTDNDPILVVDDEVDLVSTYERVLGRRGCRVISGGSRCAALALLERQPLLLLVTDVRLPDGDGLDLVRAVRQLPHPPPAIVVTGFGNRTAALAAGAAAYLSKPLALSAFAALVEDTLANRPGEQP
jgi:two-component system response regulator PilR (NtrC family)